MNVLAIVVGIVVTIAWFLSALWMMWDWGFRCGRRHERIARNEAMLQIVRHTMRETTREVRDMEEKRVAAKWN